jgi:hypothetical protein
MTVLAAGARIGAFVPSAKSLELPADSERGSVEVNMLPAESERFALAQAHR